MGCLDYAQRDANGRVYVEAVDTTAHTTDEAGRFDYSDLRCYACPVAMAQQVGRSPLLAIYRVMQAGGDPRALGYPELSEGAVDAVSELARLNGAMDLAVYRFQRAQAEAKAKARRGAR